MRHKRYKLLYHLHHTSILVLFIFALLTYFFFSRSSQRQSTDSQAAVGDTLTIMSFNLLGEPLCRGSDAHRLQMKSIMDYGREKGISILGLQEVVKQKDQQNEECEFDLPQYLVDYGSGYIQSKSEYIHIEDDPNDFEKWWYRIFMHDTPLVGGMIRHQIGAPHRGFEAIVTNTKLGPIRFIHVHNGHHQIMDSLIPFINGFKAQDQIPIIVMGDFNIEYDGENGQIDTYKRMKYLEDNAGLYRACDPVKFPNGRCTDTVRVGDRPVSIDHILIDKRATFVVKNAYVEHTRFQFSDHFPVIVELGSAELSNPTGLTYTCNANGTATFRWNAVSGAGDYAFRLDEQGTNPSSPIHNWKTSPPDIAMNTSSTTITVSVTPGRYYQWAVTAVRIPGAAHPLPTWQPAFTCAIATSTPTRIPPTATRTPTPTIPIGPPTITPTRTPTPRIITATPVAICSLRSRGDADCNGRVDIIDFICWKEEFVFRRKPSNCQTSDFNSQNGIDLIDFTVWKQEFL